MKLCSHSTFSSFTALAMQAKDDALWNSLSLSTVPRYKWDDNLAFGIDCSKLHLDDTSKHFLRGLQ